MRAGGTAQLPPLLSPDVLDAVQQRHLLLQRLELLQQGIGVWGGQAAWRGQGAVGGVARVSWGWRAGAVEHVAAWLLCLSMVSEVHSWQRPGQERGTEFVASLLPT